MTRHGQLIATMRGLLLRHHDTLPLEVRDGATQLCTALEDTEAETMRVLAKLDLDVLVRALANAASVVQTWRDHSPVPQIARPSQPANRHTTPTVAIPAMSTVRVRDAFSGTTYLHVRGRRG